MNRFDEILALARAARRLSPRMAMFMLRRVVRNALAPRLPHLYKSRIKAIQRQVPPLSTRTTITEEIREAFDLYCHEYKGDIDAFRSGDFRINGRSVYFTSLIDLDWNHYIAEEGDHQMWRVKLNHFGFSAPMLAYGEKSHHDAIKDLIAGFCSNSPVSAKGSFYGSWFPYAVSHRIIAITSGILAAREVNKIDNDLEYCLSEFVRYNVAFLLDNIEHELLNNHVERNLAALCVYFTFAEKVPKDVSTMMEAEISRLVETTVLPDGVQIERSPMYQGLSAVSLAVMAAAPFLSPHLRTTLTHKALAARKAFAILCHPDGEVALFNDGWHGEVPRLSGPPAPEGRSVLENGGYARLSNRDDVCILDAGPLGPSWNPGHGHADFLSVEVSLGGHRFIVDPGTSGYNTGPDRARERSAKAHNGPVWSGYEPVEFLGCFKVGRMAEARLVPTEAISDDLTIGGLFDTPRGRTGRLVRLYPRAGFLIVDGWSAVSPSGEVSWLIPQNWRFGRCESSVVRFSRPSSGDGACIELLSDGELDAPRGAVWASHYGKRDAAWELRLRPVAKDGLQSLACWVGHKTAKSDARADAEALASELRSLLLAP